MCNAPVKNTVERTGDVEVVFMNIAAAGFKNGKRPVAEKGLEIEEG